MTAAVTSWQEMQVSVDSSLGRVKAIYTTNYTAPAPTRR